MMYTAYKRIIFMNLTFRVLSQSQLRPLSLNLYFQKTEKRKNHHQQGRGKNEENKFSKLHEKFSKYARTDVMYFVRSRTSR